MEVRETLQNKWKKGSPARGNRAAFRGQVLETSVDEHAIATLPAMPRGLLPQHACRLDAALAIGRTLVSGFAGMYLALGLRTRHCEGVWNGRAVASALRGPMSILETHTQKKNQSSTQAMVQSGEPV